MGEEREDGKKKQGRNGEGKLKGYVAGKEMERRRERGEMGEKGEGRGRWSRGVGEKEGELEENGARKENGREGEWCG